MFLRESVASKSTGEVFYERIKSTTELNTEEFNRYLDQIGAWLFHNLGWPMPDPAEYHEKNGIVIKDKS